MAYNPYQSPYPMYYQPQTPATTQTAVQQVTTSGIIWVQGEAGAKSYLVAPNTTVALWDSEQQTIYLKSSDASGMPSIKYIDYTIRETNQPMNTTIKTDDYATKDDIEKVQFEIGDLKQKIETLNSKKTANHTKKRKEIIIEDDDDE